MRRLLCLCSGFVLLFAGLPTNTHAQRTTARLNPKGKLSLNCDDAGSGLCADTHSHKNYEGKYVGHDEPAIIFYSDKRGSGNSSVYELTLPKDAPTLPSQDGRGGTWNFQLHPAFWAGMAMCDSQSFPNFTNICNRATDANIADNIDPDAPDFIGKHPGSAFMEMQLYPPGWVGSPQLVDSRNYFAAVNIFSLGVDGATAANNNQNCLNTVGQETGNFAVITKNGVPLTPPNPGGVNFGRNNLDLNNVLFMAPGDKILILLHDTPSGLEVIIKNFMSGDTGRMVTSAANGFGQVLYQPSASSCTIAPYDFHPMYDTSNEHTRVPWVAHSFNTAFSDEIGHFEYCDNASNSFPFGCTVAGVNDPSGVDGDDLVCDGPWDPFFPGAPFQVIGGCIFTEGDFDGVSYGLNWPGTIANHRKDEQIHSRPIAFAGPLFLGEGGLHNYDRVAFETNVAGNTGGCDPVTGTGCVVPPPGVTFYPFYTTRRGDAEEEAEREGEHNGDHEEERSGEREGERNRDHEGENGVCRWQLGGAQIAGTTNNFGGNPGSAYGSPLFIPYQTGPNSAALFTGDNQRKLNHNPCKLDRGKVQDQVERLVHLDED